MKKIKAPILLVIGLILLSSCGNTMRVYRDKVEDKSNRTSVVQEKIKGIPFYTQRGVIRQETMYIYKWLEITLTKTTMGDVEEEIVLTNSKTKNRIESVIPIYTLIDSLSNTKPSNPDSLISEILNEIENLPTLTFPPDSTNAELISNNWKQDVIVDYETKYYLNTISPWFGTSTLTQKLATNGTLTEATSTIDNQLDELAAVAVSLATPISNVKIAKIENEPPLTLINNESFSELSESELFQALDAMRTPEIVYTLKTEEKGYLYNFSAIICDGPCSNEFREIRKLPFNLNSGNYTRTNWPKNEEKPQPKKDDKPTINVSGSIQLPDKEN